MEPFKIKVVEPIAFTTRTERDQALAAAGYNLFNVPASLITIDLLTDSGTSAMSDRQWAGIMLGDESYAGSRNYFHLEEVVRRITGYRHVIPTHQGRVAENLLFTTAVKPGDRVPNNIHFDTTRANVEHNLGVPVDCVIDAAYDVTAEHPFKGNMDVAKLDRLLAEVGKARVPLVMLTITNNSGGGQPVSLGNARQTSVWCRRHRIPLFFDACRFAENAYFCKQRDPECAGKSIEEIARAFFALGDGCTMSAKKDGLVNIGGFIATNDDELSTRLSNMLILIEGFTTYGGLAGRDLEAIAIGLGEVLDERYLEHRVGQVRRFGEALRAAGVPIVLPVGGHGVYLDARRFLPHIPQHQFPAQALTCALYLEGGVRGVEIGGLMLGKLDEATGAWTWPELELVRLAVPRRVYTDAHLDHVVAVCTRILQERDAIRGLRIVSRAPVLPHFTARLAPLGGPA
ncbi:MAG TPA: tryptophanase [Gemmatimonadales bacterium]|nr:tryptophanase [Gemmatimonadales bacterium]